MVNARKQYEQLRRVWAQLPDGPMTNEELEQAIIRAAGLRGAGGAAGGVDLAGASAQASMLKAGGAIRVVAGEGCLLNLKTSEFPKFTDPNDPSVMQAAAVKAAREQREERLKREQWIAEQHARDAAAQEARDRPYINRLVDARLRELGLMPSEESRERRA